MNDVELIFRGMSDERFDAKVWKNRWGNIDNIEDFLGFFPFARDMRFLFNADLIVVLMEHNTQRQLIILVSTHIPLPSVQFREVDGSSKAEYVFLDARYDLSDDRWVDHIEWWKHRGSNPELHNAIVS